MTTKQMKKKFASAPKYVRICACLGDQVVVVTKVRECYLCGARTKKRLTADLITKYVGKTAAVVEKAKGGNGFTVEQRKVADIIEEKCAQLTCPGKVVGVQAGPMVTRYDFLPDKFTRVRKLKALNEDVALATQAESAMVQRMPKTGVMAVTLPNKERKTTLFQDTLPFFLSKRKEMELPLNLGLTQIGDPIVEDLADYPHMLIAGSTNAGKSNLIHMILTSLLVAKTPAEMEWSLCDPKQVELMRYENLPHLKTNISCRVNQILDTLDVTIYEMENRLKTIQSQDCQDLKQYNKKMAAAGLKQLPRRIIVIDEMAEIIVQEKKAFTDRLTRIASVARAAGIHVIAATQRPDAKLLTGAIKCNFPTRVALRVPSAHDSKTILHQGGAEQLLGQGDALLMTQRRSGLERMHTALITTDDIERVLSMVRSCGTTSGQVPADMMAVPTVQAAPQGRVVVQ